MKTSMELDEIEDSISNWQVQEFFWESLRVLRQANSQRTMPLIENRENSETGGGG